MITSILIGVAIVVFSRKNGRIGIMLGLLISAVALWTFTTALDLASIALEGKIFWSKIQYIGIFTTPGFLFLFIYYFYSNNKPLSKTKIFLLWIIPIITILLAFTNELHSLVWTDFTPSPIQGSNLIIYHHGYWFWIAFSYYYLLLVLSIYLLTRAVKEPPAHKKRNAGLMLFAFPFPVIGNLLYNFNLSPWPGYDLTAVGFAIASFFLLWGVSRQNLVDLTPMAREKLFDNLNEGVLIIDWNESIVDHNQATLEILRRKGYDIGRGILNRTVKNFVQDLEDLSPIFYSDRGYPRIIPAITIDEPVLEVNQQLLEKGGEQTGRLIIIRDITQQKQAESQLLWQQRQLAAEQERKNIGRELHDNLAQVLGYINLQSKTILNLLEDGDTTNAASQVAQLINISQDANNDVRKFIQDSSQNPKPQKGFIPALDSYIESFEQLTGIPVTLRLNDIDFDTITTTKSRLQILRIIQETLSNVRKHAEAKSILINFSQNADSLIVSVTDDGCGFDINQSVKEGHFGLKIMKERAKESGAILTINTNPGRGTEVQLKFPMTINTSIVELKKLKFMIVDDHPLIVEGVKNLLTSHGLSVIDTAQSGEEALEKLMKIHPNIILMDVHMPGLSGPKTTQLIKHRYPEIKILMLTMSDHVEDLQESIENGANGYILKSQSPDQLFSSLERILQEPLVISAEMTKRTLEHRMLGYNEPIKIEVPSEVYELSAIELDILERVALGEGYKEIGQALNLSPHTIKYHFNKVLNKLEIETRGEAIHMAIQTGLIKGRRQTDPII
jgi:signal transduction histidine kinase/DNA-binding NarL/FixJ family response regulator